MCLHVSLFNWSNKSRQPYSTVMNTDNPPWMHIATIFPSYSTPPILALRGLGPVKTTLTMSNSAQKLKPTNLFNACTAMGVVGGGNVGPRGRTCRQQTWGGRTQECAMMTVIGWGRQSFFCLSRLGKKRWLGGRSKHLSFWDPSLMLERAGTTGWGASRNEGVLTADWRKQCVCVCACERASGDTTEWQGWRGGEVGRRWLDYVRYQIGGRAGMMALWRLREGAIWYAHIAVGLSTVFRCEETGGGRRDVWSGHGIVG